jgi:radical SAM protein with 4Fe4S-binding SPASM domain
MIVRNRMPTARRRPPVPLPVLLEPPAALLPRAIPADLPEFPVGDPFNPHKVLNHFDRLQKLVRGEIVSPITVEIDPTNLCNHRCAWCVSIEAHTGEKLGLERFSSLIAELKEADVRSVVLKGGGEPTTHPQFIEMLDVLRDAGLAVGLITNGSMPRKGSVEKVAEVCDWARVSLDAATADVHEAIHGSKDFAKIIQNIAALTSQGGRTMVGLNFVAEPRNFREMADFTAMAKSLGAAYVTIRCVFDPSNPLPESTRDAMRANAIAAKQMEGGGFRVFLGNFTDRYLNADSAAPFPFARCLGPNLIGVVGGDGEVYACCFLRGNKAFSFGNVHTQSFNEVWTSDRRQQVMNSVYRGDCGRVCAGGMTANRYTTYNEILNYLAAEEKRHFEFA